MRKMKTLQLTVDAMLAALCAVLGYVSLDLGNFKITFEAIPILIAAMVIGPVDAALVAGVGTFVYQVLRYGVTATTILWIIPYIVYGLFVGMYSKKVNFKFNYILTAVVLMFAAVMITVLNTGALIIDSKIYGYYSPVYVFGSLGVRLVVGVCKAAVLAAVMPTLLKIIGNIREVELLRGSNGDNNR